MSENITVLRLFVVSRCDTLILEIHLDWRMRRHNERAVRCDVVTHLGVTPTFRRSAFLQPAPAASPGAGYISNAVSGGLPRDAVDPYANSFM